MSKLFPDTREHRFDTGEAEIFARSGGKGPPLLLIHGFPQTHAMWHRVAPTLMQHFTCVLPDLRGYGFSSCPENARDNTTYSKRAMAADLVKLMASLGHERFAVAGHDRGARVTYRMALDHPQAIMAAAVLDIVPTTEMWRTMDAAMAMNTYHWLFLAQPNPLPEMLIEQAPVAFLDYTLASWTAAKALTAFHPDALAEYRTHFATPDHIHATCCDYRAGQTADLRDDDADCAAGRKIKAPLLAIWGESGFPGKTHDTLAVWRQWADNVTGGPVKSGHFLTEENPDETLAHLLPFFREHCR